MEPDALLWQDTDTKKDVLEKIKAAVNRYEQKYGRRPTECWVNDRVEVPPDVDGVRIVKKHYVLAHHFQVGVA